MIFLSRVLLSLYCTISIERIEADLHATLSLVAILCRKGCLTRRTWGRRCPDRGLPSCLKSHLGEGAVFFYMDSFFRSRLLLLRKTYGSFFHWSRPLCAWHNSTLVATGSVFFNTAFMLDTEKSTSLSQVFREHKRKTTPKRINIQTKI